MLPEVNLYLQYNIDHGQLPNTGLPLAEIFVLCGFYMIYIVEEVTHRIIDKVNGVKPSKGVKEENGKMLGSNGHSHSHQMSHEEEAVQNLEGADQSLEAAVRGFLVVLAISLHAVFEGIAMGLTHSTRSVWFLLFAISSHKYVISFCIGLQFVTSGLKPMLSSIYVATFALISPLGAGIGILLSESITNEAETQTVLVTVLQGLATGTLLYVVFFEVIEKERAKGTSGLIQVTFSILGFVIMVALECVELFSSQQVSLRSVNCQVGSEGINLQDLPANVTCQDGTILKLFS